MMNNSLKRLRTVLPMAFLFTAIFLIAFSLGSITFLIFNYTHNTSKVTELDEPAALPRVTPAPQHAELGTNVHANPFQGMWRVYWPSWDGTPLELTQLPVINLILYAEQDRFTGKAFFYNVRNDGYGLYVAKATEAVLTDIRLHKGALYFHVHKGDEETAYKLWLENQSEAKLCVVGKGPATVFRVKRGPSKLLNGEI